MSWAQKLLPPARTVLFLFIKPDGTVEVRRPNKNGDPFGSQADLAQAECVLAVTDASTVKVVKAR